MRTAPSLLALAIASALSFPLHAETPADADGTRTLDPVEVKAQREKQASANQNVTVIGAGQIEDRSEEHTSELQSLMRISYAVFSLKKQTTNQPTQPTESRFKPITTYNKLTN